MFDMFYLLENHRIANYTGDFTPYSAKTKQKNKKKRTEKKRKKSKKAQWYFHLNMTFLGFTDLYTKVISLSLR